MGQPTEQTISPIASLLEELQFPESPYARAPLQLELGAAPMDRWARITPLFVDGEGVWLTRTEHVVPRIAPQRKAFAPLRPKKERARTRTEKVVMMTLAAIAVVAAAALPLFV
jgi:hypothetical protein